MYLAITLLILFSFQQPEKVALTFGPEPTRTEFMQTEDAKRLFEAVDLKLQSGTNTAEDDRLHAALTAALGTLPDQERLTAPTLENRSGWEVKRGVRKPLQKPEAIKQ